jgi:hypothetical protein
MTTLPLTYHNPPRANIILIMLIGIMLFVVGVTMSHAITKHGDNAVRVSDCMDNQGPIQEWYNAANNHTIYICQVAPTVFGIDVLASINGRWERITSFIKEKFTRIDQVENYMRNSGAVRVK